MRILLAGVSVRWLAQSAVRAGCEVVCLDHFGDLDLPPGEHVAGGSAPGAGAYDARSMPALAAGMRYDALAYSANLENHPAVVEQLAAGRQVIGNPPNVLRTVRSWPELYGFCLGHGVDMPPTLFQGGGILAGIDPAQWLLKPGASGGGHGIRQWAGGEPETGWYLQKRVDGVVASAVFEADGNRCRILGIGEQLTGLDEFGAQGFRYCGNLFPLAPESGGGEAVERWVRESASRLTARYGLRGVNGLDFIIPAEGSPKLLEVNPRPPASAELVELALGENLFSAHLHPLASKGPDSGPKPGVHGKAIVYARRDLTIPDTGDWYAKLRRDIPHAGAKIRAQHPVCTVLASGPDRAQCLRLLKNAAKQVRLEIGDREDAEQD